MAKKVTGLFIGEMGFFGDIVFQTKIGFLVFVEDRSQVTLHSKIRQYLRPGSIIHFDEWRLYNGIDAILVTSRLPNMHLSTTPYGSRCLNRSAGVHTNAIECMWKTRSESSIKSMLGFLWRKRYEKIHMDSYKKYIETGILLILISC